MLIPGPWWTPLTYACRDFPSPAPLPGSRVSVPLGKTHRVGFYLAREKKTSQVMSERFSIRETGDFLEILPPMGKELWDLALWMSKRYLCAPGIALKTILPEPILRGEIISPLSTKESGDKGNPRHSCVYRGRDCDRYEIYANLLAENPSWKGIFIFPEIEQARTYWAFLEKRNLAGNGALWDMRARDKKERQFLLWKNLRQGNVSFLVGSLGAIFAPLEKMDFIVIDQEESGAYEHRKTPFFHARSVLAKRGDFFSSHMYFGGRVPSSRIFLRLQPVCQGPPQVSFVFVHLSRAVPLALEGTEKDVPLSKKLLEKSVELQGKGEAVLWIFDRTDENRELFCVDCGYVFVCPHCGGTWEASNAALWHCSRCGASQQAQEFCPACRGKILSYRGAGLRSLHAKVQSLFGKNVPCYFFDRKKKFGGLSLKEIEKSGGIIVGTRRALSLCDSLPITLIGWLDADAEARRSSYNAHEKAFRMICESSWRGLEKSPSRIIVLQSRNPRKGWQGALERGWDLFWKEELRKRKTFAFPPYGTLVEVSAHPEIMHSLEEELEKNDIVFSRFSKIQDNSQETLWIKCDGTMPLFRIVYKIFGIWNPYAKKRNSHTLRIWRD